MPNEIRRRVGPLPFGKHGFLPTWWRGFRALATLFWSQFLRVDLQSRAVTTGGEDVPLPGILPSVEFSPAGALNDNDPHVVSIALAANAAANAAVRVDGRAHRADTPALARR